MNRQEFAAAIRRKIEEDGSTQEKAAAAAGVHQSAFHRIYHGKGFDFDNYARICIWLGCPVNRFMGREIRTVSGNTLENIREVIRTDTNLTNINKKRLWRLFQAMYHALKD